MQYIANVMKADMDVAAFARRAEVTGWDGIAGSVRDIVQFLHPIPLRMIMGSGYGFCFAGWGL